MLLVFNYLSKLLFQLSLKTLARFLSQSLGRDLFFNPEQPGSTSNITNDGFVAISHLTWY